MQDENSKFYWPEWHRFNEHGTLTMKVTGWEGDCHWTGSMTVEPMEPDYAFWFWAIKEKNCTELINDEKFKELKQEFAGITS